MIIINLGKNVTTNATGTTNRIVSSVRNKFILQVVGSGTFVAAVEGSLDGTNWFTLASKTASDLFEVSVCPYLRLVTSGMSGADVTVNAVV